jgi:hypothetical protein
MRSGEIESPIHAKSRKQMPATAATAANCRTVTSITSSVDARLPAMHRLVANGQAGLARHGVSLSKCG